MKKLQLNSPNESMHSGNLQERINKKQAEIAEMQSKLERHARHGRFGGTTEHAIMQRLQTELSDLLTEVDNG